MTAIALSYMLVFISINKFSDNDYVDSNDRINFGQIFQADIRIEFELYISYNILDLNLMQGVYILDSNF